MGSFFFFFGYYTVSMTECGVQTPGRTAAGEHLVSEARFERIWEKTY